MAWIGLLIAMVLGCGGDGGAEACTKAKDEAKRAWGSVGVRYGLALEDAKRELRDREGRLKAMDLHKDVPPAARAALQKEVDDATAKAAPLQASVDACEQVRSAFSLRPAREAHALGQKTATTLEGADVPTALARGEEAVQACQEAEP